MLPPGAVISGFRSRLPGTPQEEKSLGTKPPGDIRHGADLIGNDHLSAVQAGRLVLLGGGENALGADHRDEDGRVLVLIARQVHVEVVGAVIIINDGGSRPGLHGIVRLDIERNTAAAGDQDDLAGEVEALKALVCAEDVLARRRVAKEDESYVVPDLSAEVSSVVNA